MTIPRHVDTGGTIPGGILKTRAYYVKTVAGDDITISTTLGGSTLNITNDGTGTFIMYVEASDTEDTGSGSGAEFTGTYEVAPSSLTGGASGVNLDLTLTYAVLSLVLDQAGTLYISAPTVTITGSTGTNATASASVTAITIGDSTGYVVDVFSEPDGGPNVECFWVTMPKPPDYAMETQGPWVKPGRYTILYTVVHDPPWLGIDFISTPPLSCDVDYLVCYYYQFGPFTRAQMFEAFSITTPGAESALFRGIRDRTIHNAFAYSRSDGSYAESVPASTVTGGWPNNSMPTLYCISCKQREIATNLYQMIATFVPAT